jgi:hypothetical protein
MFMNGVFVSTYRIHCVFCETSIMMMQYLSYLEWYAMLVIVVVASVLATTLVRRSMSLLCGRQLGLRRCDGVKQIVISVYNILFVAAIYVWIDQSLYFLVSLAQPSYLEARVHLAIHDHCLAQRIKSAYSCLGPTFVFGMFVDRGVRFRSRSVLGEDSQVPLLRVRLVFSDHAHLPGGLCPDVIPQFVTVFDSEQS